MIFGAFFLLYIHVRTCMYVGTDAYVQLAIVVIQFQQYGTYVYTFVLDHFVPLPLRSGHSKARACMLMYITYPYMHVCCVIQMIFMNSSHYLYL